jgi:hypothetical protein
MIFTPISKLRWQSDDINNTTIDIKCKGNNVTLIIFSNDTGEISLHKELTSVMEAIKFARLFKILRGSKCES